MYPINAASPERIAVGAVVQISDGSVQTTGVTVSVTKQGGSETGSAGTVAFSTGGVCFYTPTQGETNATSFIVTAYKTGCIPVSVTVITTASGVPGYAGLDWAKINAPTTAQGLTGTTIATSQVVASVSGAVGSVTGAVGSVTGAVGSVSSVSNIVTGAITVSGGIASADIKKVNNVTVNGDGAGTPWGP